MIDDARKRGQHHGDARAALVDAAHELLEDAGAAALSLRAVAERAGLSRQAPYNHFADKEAMLAAVAAAGFGRLAGELRASGRGRVGADALAAAGEAYIAFAQTTPALFRLMFSRELVHIAKFPDARAISMDAFDALVEIVATLCAAERVEEVSLAAWCVVHGYATLCNEAGIEPPDRRRERARQFTDIIMTYAVTAGGDTHAGQGEGQG